MAGQGATQIHCDDPPGRGKAHGMVLTPFRLGGRELIRSQPSVPTRALSRHPRPMSVCRLSRGHMRTPGRRRRRGRVGNGSKVPLWRRASFPGSCLSAGGGSNLCPSRAATPSERWLSNSWPASQSLEGRSGGRAGWRTSSLPVPLQPQWHAGPGTPRTLITGSQSPLSLRTSAEEQRTDSAARPGSIDGFSKARIRSTLTCLQVVCACI